MATEQAALALTAYELSKDGSSLYEMSAKAEPTEPENPDTPAQPGDSVKPGDCSGEPVNPPTGAAVAVIPAAFAAAAVATTGIVLKKRSK